MQLEVRLEVQPLANDFRLLPPFDSKVRPANLCLDADGLKITPAGEAHRWRGRFAPSDRTRILPSAGPLGGTTVKEGICEQCFLKP